MLNIQRGPRRGGFSWRWWWQSPLEDFAQVQQCPGGKTRGGAPQALIHSHKKMANRLLLPHSLMSKVELMRQKIDIFYGAGEFSPFFPQKILYKDALAPL